MNRLFESKTLPIPFILFVLIFPTLTVAIAGDFAANTPVISSISKTTTNKVVVYRYEGFMGYGDNKSPTLNRSAIDDYVFHNWAAANNLTVELVETTDANALLTRLETEKAAPKADVVIGLDNALLALAKAKGIATAILEPYVPENSSQLRQDLVSQLDSSHLLTPIDYGALAFYYDLTRLNQGSLPEIGSLELKELTNPTIASQIIYESAVTSSPGTGFLLWTIAISKIIGEPDYWETFWSEVKGVSQVSPSWGDAIAKWSEPANNRGIMLSYATSPAYDKCVFNSTNTAAFFTNEFGRNNSWLQIEGIGLVKGGQNPEGGNKLIDRMVSNSVQEKIPVTNWMYPAKTLALANLPQCFTDGAISPDQLNTLNNNLTIQEVVTGISEWLDTWDKIMAQDLSPLFLLFLAMLVVTALVTWWLVKKRNSRREKSEL